MADNNPVPQNQPLQAFPTPNVGDVLIYTIVDSKVGPFNKVKEYGSAYPNAAQYPEHKLVFISPIDEDGNRKYYYACDRLRQDDYNYEISHPYGGRKDAPRYTRTYFLKREGYVALADGVADPVFPTAILIGQEMKRIGVQELDSLYVVVQRTYDVIPAATAFDGATDSTLHSYGISVDYPYNDEAYPRLTWSIPIKHTGYTATADLTNCTVSGFTPLKLIEQEYKQNLQAAELGTWTRVYEILPSRKNKTIDDDADWGQVSKFNYRDAEGACPAIGATFTDDAAATYKVVRAQQTPASGSVIAISVVALPSAASQTGTLKHTDLTDENWGSVDKYEQWGLASRTIPAIGAATTIGSGTVLTAQLLDNDGTYANLVVTTLASTTGTLKHSKLTDGDWGSIDKYEQWGLSSRSLPAIGAASSIGSGTVLTAQLLDNDGTYANLVVTTLSSTSGTELTGSEIDKIFCITQTIKQKVPSSTVMSAFYRGASYQGKYVLDARLIDDDGEHATLVLRLTDDNVAQFTEYELDEETGLVFPRVTLYSIGTTQPGGMDVNSAATYIETKRLDCNFWVSTTSKTTTLTTESYSLVVPGKWPEVLESLTLNPVYDNNDIISKYIVDFETKKAYIGSCNALYTRTWSKSVPAGTPTVTLVPEGGYYNGIFISFPIPSTLHFAFTITENTGTSHPDYRYMVRTKKFAATNYINWPASIVQECNIERYKGGYTKETLVVYAPS